MKQEKLAGNKEGDNVVLGADVIRSEYRLATPNRSAMQQREILSESTVSLYATFFFFLIRNLFITFIIVWAAYLISLSEE